MAVPSRPGLRLLPIVRYVLWRVGLINLLVYLSAGVVLYQNRLQYEVQTTASARNLVQSLEVNVSGVIDKVDVALVAMVLDAERQLSLGALDVRELDGYLNRQITQLPELTGLRIADETGHVVAGTGLQAHPNLLIAERDYFQQLAAQTQDQLLISKPFISQIRTEWVLALARRINRPDGSFGGVAIAILPLDYFSRLFNSLDVGAHGVVSMRDESLALLARAPEHEGIGRSVGNRVVSAQTRHHIATKPESGDYETVVTLDGVTRRMAYRKAARQQLYIFVGQAIEDYLAPWWRQVQLVLSLALSFTLITIWAAVASFRREHAQMLAIDELRRGKEELARSEAKFRSLYDSTRDAMLLLDGEIIVDCNRSALDLFGLSSRVQPMAEALLQLSPALQGCGEASQQKLPTLLAQAKAEGVAQFDWMFRRKGSETDFPADVLLNVFELDGRTLIQAVVRDITERRQAEAKIRHLAYFDALTDLPNRRLLMDRLGLALNASQRSGEFGAVMILDLDNFKSLNDTQGHDVGDRLLVEVAQRVSGCVRQEDTVSRFGGDEYVLLLQALGGEMTVAAGHAETVAEKVRQVLGLPHQLGAKRPAYHFTASIGIALFCGNEVSVEDLLKQADLALYQAKAGGRNASRFFNPAMQAAIDSRLEMETALREGIEKSEFQLFYQPQMDLSGWVLGAEALLRWTPAGRPSISPASFIPVAEETGQILPLGQWVLLNACEQLASWALDEQTRHLSLAVNVSARQFRQPDFVEQIRAALLRSGASAERLKLELTESVVLENVDAVVERMRQIKALGVSFSLDDFGTGFSSLSYLKRLPVDQVKIDQSFVRDVTTDPNDAAIVKAIIAMSQSLGLHIIAEGVETAAQRDFLADCGCTAFQGYLFGRPLPIEAWVPVVFARPD